MLRVAALAIAVLLLWGGQAAQAGEPSQLVLDFDISDGACVDIDADAAIEVSETVHVAVCLLDNTTAVPLAAFQYYLVYDDSVVVVPEGLDEGDGLDDNPDANGGDVTFVSKTFPESLGNGWDCHSGVGAFPVGDLDDAIGPGHGRAFSGGCWGVAGPNTLIIGPLGVIRFEGAAVGVTTVEVCGAQAVNDALYEVGSCNPTIDAPMTCVGGTITVLPSDEPDAGAPDVGASADVEASESEAESESESEGDPMVNLGAAASGCGCRIGARW